MKHEKIILKEKSYLIQGVIFEVYREMGSGFLEAVYQECLEKEFMMQKIPFNSQKEITINYKGEKLIQKYIPDFICYNKIILEIKAVKYVKPEHKSQLINYMVATDNKLGFLVNFGSYPKVDITRIVL